MVYRQLLQQMCFHRLAWPMVLTGAVCSVQMQLILLLLVDHQHALAAWSSVADN
jgi:hypothetical protein